MSRRKSWLWCGSTAPLTAFQQNLKQWRRVTAALQQRWEAVAAGPISIKHFFQFFVDFAGHSTAGVSQIEGMMGSVPRPVTAAVGGESFRIWQKDRQRVEQGHRGGAALRGVPQ